MANKRWEYMFITEEDYKPKSVNGRDLPNWKSGPHISDYLNTLGGQGWEATGLGVQGNHFYFLLKREIL